MANIYYVKKGNLITIYNVPWDFVKETLVIFDVTYFDKLLNGKFKVTLRVPVYNSQKGMNTIKELIEKYEKTSNEEENQ